MTDAVLVRCPCGVDEPDGEEALTPIALANRVPPGTRVVLVGKDGAGSVEQPDIDGYAERLLTRGVEARVEPLPAGGGEDAMHAAVAQAVEELLR